MPQDKDVIRLHHMLDHAREAVALAAGRTEADLSTDRTLELSLIRLVEVIGEAAARVSEERRGQHPEINWRVIVGMRHHLIHGYDTIAHDILWDTVTRNLPSLIADLEKVLSALEPGGPQD